MQLLVESTAVVMFRQIAEAKLEPVLTDLLYYFERDEARHVGLGVLTLPEVLVRARRARRRAAVVVPDQDEPRDDPVAGSTCRPAFETLGIDQAEMNLQGFRYHAEILRRMKKETRRPAQGADARSRSAGCSRCRARARTGSSEFLFAPAERSPAQARMFDALVSVAQRTDRWLAGRAPVT